MNHTKRRLLITGSSGFIGSAIAIEALKQNYEVIGIDIAHSRVKGIKFLKSDITDCVAVKKAVQGADYIIHLAAITSNVEFDKDLEKCYRINVEGFSNVINAATASGCKKFLYASSAAVYPPGVGFSENSLIDIRKQRNHYGKSKLINEMMADSYSDKSEMLIIGMRLFNVFGPGENEKGNYASIITNFLNEKRKARPTVIYGDGSQARDFIYIDDAAKISLLLLEKGKDPIYNVGTGVATSYENIADIVGGSKKHVRNPLSSYQMLTQADTGRLLKPLGNFRFTSVEEGIRRTDKQPFQI